MALAWRPLGTPSSLRIRESPMLGVQTASSPRGNLSEQVGGTKPPHLIYQDCRTEEADFTTLI